jgi:hypothetical protein
MTRRRLAAACLAMGGKCGAVNRCLGHRRSGGVGAMKTYLNILTLAVPIARPSPGCNNMHLLTILF